MVYHEDILSAARRNPNFRTVVVTNRHSQVVLMSLAPGEGIGMEVHDVDQVLVIVEGTGTATLNGAESAVAPGHCVVVPAGTQHNFTNAGSKPMKLYTVYAPPEHRDGTVHKTKADAAADEHDEPS